MSNSIKTILSIDDSDVKAKLKALEAHYKATYAGWVDATDKLKQKDKELINVKGELARMEKIRNDEKLKGASADKTILAGMNEAIKAHKDTIRVLQSEKNEIKAVADAHNVEMQAVKKATAANQPYNQSLEQQWNHFIRIARWGGTLAGVYFGITRAWEATIGKGIELNRQIEDMGMGISALTAANTSNISSSGAYLTAMDKFNIATTMTTSTMKLLRKAAIDTPASFTEMASIFQQAYVSTSKMGKGFGLTVDDITKNTVQLATRMANIAGAIGMPMQKALEETRSLMSGQASGDSLIASLLFGSPAAANEAMRKAEKDGALAVKNMLDGVMASFDVLAGVDTYTKSLAQMKGAYEALLTEMTKPIYNDLSATFKDITKYFDESTEAGKKNQQMIIDWSEEYSDKMKVAGGVVLDFGEIFLDSMINIQKAVWITGGIIQDALGEASDGATKNFGLFDYLILGFASVVTAAKTAVNFMETEFRRSENTIKKLRIVSNPLNYLPTESGEEWNGQKVMTTGATKELAKLKYSTALIDADMTARTDAEIDKITKVYNSLAKVREKSVGKGGGRSDSLMQGLDVDGIGETYKIIEAHKSSELKVTEALAKEEKKIVAYREQMARITGTDAGSLKEKGVVTNAIALSEQAILSLKKEQSELNSKTASKMESAAKKQASEEVSAFNLKKQGLETALAIAQFEASQKTAGYELEEGKLNTIQKLKLEQFDLTAEGQANELVEASKITNEKNKEQAVNVAMEKIYKTLTDKEEYRLRLQKGITEETEKEATAHDRIANTELKGELRKIKTASERGRGDIALTRAFGKGAYGTEEADALISSAWNATSGKMAGMTDEGQLAKAEEEFNKFVDDINAKIAEIPDVTLNVKLEGFDEVSNSIASFGNAFSEVVHTQDIYNTTMKELADQQAKLNKSDEKWIALEKKKGNLERKNASDSLGEYSDLVGAVKSFYGTETKEAKRLGEVQKALNAAKMAMDFANMAQSTAFTGLFVAQEATKSTAAGVTAVATAASSSPWTGFATAAAMIALLASIGIMLSGGGGSSDAPISVYDQYAAMSDNMGTGTALGSDEASESIIKSLDILSDYKKPEYHLLASMEQSLKSIDNKIGGVTSLLLRTGGFALGEGYAGSSSVTTMGDVAKINAKISTLINDKVEDFADKVDGVLGFLDPLLGLVGASGTFSSLLKVAFGGYVTEFLGGLVAKAFGGGTSIFSSMTDYGIQFNNQLLTSAMQAISAAAYQTTLTVVSTDGGWFGNDSTYAFYNTAFQGLSSEITNQFTQVLGELYNTTLSVGDALDTSSTDVEANLANFIVSIGKISLQGKSGEAIQEQLTNVFGSIADQIAVTAFPLISAFQKVGEGMFETLIRVASGMELAEGFISRLGVAFDDPKYTELQNKQGDVGLEALRQSILEFEATAYGATSGVYNMVSVLGESAEELYGIYVAFEGLRIQLDAIGKSAQYLTADMVMGAGSIDDLQGGMESYIENFMTEQEHLGYTMSVMTAEFAKLGMSLPASSDAFVDLIESIDVSTSSGQELYGRLIILSEGFSELSTEQENVYSGVIDLANAFKGLGESITDTINKLLGMDAGTDTRSKISSFWDKKLQLDTLLAKDGDLTPSEQSTIKELVGSINSISLSMGGVSGGLTSSLVGTLGGIRTELGIDEATLLAAIGGGTSTEEVGILTALRDVLPSFAVGSSYLPNDMLANVHKGEMIIDPKSSEVLRKYGISTNDYLSPVMEKVYGKLSEMNTYLKRMDSNFDSVVSGRAIRTIAS